MSRIRNHPLDRWWCTEGCGFVGENHRCEQWCEAIRIPGEAIQRLRDEWKKPKKKRRKRKRKQLPLSRLIDAMPCSYCGARPNKPCVTVEGERPGYPTVTHICRVHDAHWKR